jgi:hypothetical protein
MHRLLEDRQAAQRVGARGQEAARRYFHYANMAEPVARFIRCHTGHED